MSRNDNDKRSDRLLLDWIESRMASLSRPMILGICGSQGSGKSTLARHLSTAFQAAGRRVAVLSLDDLYLNRQARQKLSREIHPLLATRGVPGTHDVNLGCKLLDSLQGLAPGETLKLPRFDKANDEPHPPSQWTKLRGPVDLILFEGWCVGLRAQPPAALADPVNSLEREEDADGRWRHWVNQRLEQDYPALFGRLDALLYLQIPNFAVVQRWREQQEAETAAAAGPGAARVMDAPALRRFIAHYERLSRHAMHSLPAQADVLRTLDAQHRVLAQVFHA